MRQTDVRRLVLDVVRRFAPGRPIASGTEFSHIGVGPWQRQRFFGPLRDAFGRHGFDITDDALNREAFTHFQTLREVQAAVWNNVRRGPASARHEKVQP